MDRFEQVESIALRMADKLGSIEYVIFDVDGLLSAFEIPTDR